MRTKKCLVVLTIAAVLVGCGYEPEEEATERSAVTSADASWWRGLSQAQRNQEILNRAKRDNGADVGVQCKIWAQRVVSDASRGAAVVPTTAPDASGWYWNWNQYAVGLSTYIRNVQPGWIVQMRRPDRNGLFGPHTAIVFSVMSDGIWWIDSNWVAANKVGTHFETFDAFMRATTENGASHYSVYYMSGG